MLHIFTQEEINDFINIREGETKLGQKVSVIDVESDFFEAIKNSSARFVIVGVPEDIGVKMNSGKGGAYMAFFPAIKNLLNVQENQFISGKELLVLGYLDFFKTVENFKNDDAEKGDYLVKQIDKELSKLIHLIIDSDKIPIIIGGGHNNSYGNLKGFFKAKNKPVNVVNLDAHSDLRRLEERHSGNGFSYAFDEGYINKYFMFGLHENYTPQYIFDFIHENINFEYNTFEELAVYKSTPFETELKRAFQFIKDEPFGVEIDLDSVQYFPSSAMTPTGFSPRHARRFVYYFGKSSHANYLHICEAAPKLSNQLNAENQVGKFISYLITDFIKAKRME